MIDDEHYVFPEDLKKADASLENSHEDAIYALIIDCLKKGTNYDTFKSSQNYEFFKKRLKRENPEFLV